jgi:L-lactate dehydrogenase complex protein LldE
MHVALMVPCYIDSFYPQVGIATLELLERPNIDVTYPAEQTCCGQPMANSGCCNEAKGTEENFVRVFCDFEYIVTPSGSCTHHIRNKFTAVSDSPARQRRHTHSEEMTPSSRDM